MYIYIYLVNIFVIASSSVVDRDVHARAAAFARRHHRDARGHREKRRRRWGLERGERRDDGDDYDDDDGAIGNDAIKGSCEHAGVAVVGGGGGARRAVRGGEGAGAGEPAAHARAHASAREWGEK